MKVFVSGESGVRKVSSVTWGFGGKELHVLKENL